jgi:hypothetical protein
MVMQSASNFANLNRATPAMHIWFVKQGFPVIMNFKQEIPIAQIAARAERFYADAPFSYSAYISQIRLFHIQLFN